MWQRWRSPDVSGCAHASTEMALGDDTCTLAAAKPSHRDREPSPVQAGDRTKGRNMGSGSTGTPAQLTKLRCRLEEATPRPQLWRLLLAAEPQRCRALLEPALVSAASSPVRLCSSPLKRRHAVSCLVKAASLSFLRLCALCGCSEQTLFPPSERRPAALKPVALLTEL